MGSATSVGSQRLRSIRIALWPAPSGASRSWALPSQILTVTDLPKCVHDSSCTDPHARVLGPFPYPAKCLLSGHLAA
eukprot:11906037-Alexandrium_andersonii.AAC.1